MQNYTYFMNSTMSPSFTLLIILLAVWSLFWKGLALWQAVKRREKKWFIAILILNTAGILELVYLFYFVKIKSLKLE